MCLDTEELKQLFHPLALTLMDYMSTVPFTSTVTVHSSSVSAHTLPYSALMHHTLWLQINFTLQQIHQI
ncbi:hypothetical protein E2C01_014360 [Portunus trituberculatus]|uniref:Uncharacterized protein n=1 Tax=Portunus trituberculatus TaxID=210409 RepID=A0A5B7DJS9_PORTR|nr:hypothetical protein [Portunus trituberculatus]